MDDSAIALPAKGVRTLLKPWLITLIVGGLLGYIATRYFPAPPASHIEPIDYMGRIQACQGQSMKLMGASTADLTAQSQISAQCMSRISVEAALNDFNIRRLIYVSQQFETIVLMWMVVIITFSGVLLAGLQLMAAYQLASTGKGSMDSASEVTLNARRSELSLKSSYVGLLILAASFAFFFVFVKSVYPVVEDKSTANTAASPPPQTLPMLTSNPGILGLPPANAPASSPSTASHTAASARTAKHRP
ncbi:hypothetical protein [Caballeronia sp. LZ032]|uniref:hypothetical protein n=1 Tax=Caballeronia sp. LZ032 TaxID=3038565 RepID=UPI00285E031A|nr:hypothetical protein [Caballeronia sp. LZ032]MDR5878794.1 hypothetical protein [Caballeronia sp. LZ032]